MSSVVTVENAYAATAHAPISAKSRDRWVREHKQLHFRNPRPLFANPPILRLPDFEKVSVLQTDACSDGIGTILLQEEEGLKHPMAFASRKLLQRESHYSTIEKECLAILWAMQTFRNFFYGKSFVFETDHKPLEYLLCYQLGFVFHEQCDADD